MELSAHAIRGTEFKTVKKGYDPDEVDAFKDEVAAVVEAAQSQAAAMESRARAAVARLQEVSQQSSSAPREATPSAPVRPTGEVSGGGDTEMISRTLLLAQRTADNTVAEARIEAESLTKGARQEATQVVDNARTMAARLIEDAKVEAHRSKEDELARAENELQALLARRDFLLADVDQLEQFIIGQRERLREAALDLQDIVERVPGGLGDMRRPLMSASAESMVQRAAVAPEAPAPVPEPAAPVVQPVAPPAPEPDDDDPMSLFESADQPRGRRGFADESADPWGAFDEGSLPTGELPVTRAAGRHRLEDITAEVPSIRSPATDDPFRIAGDELR
ncbi:MAG: DivIVA domain-containing protein [Actinomycetota bacterium]